MIFGFSKHPGYLVKFCFPNVFIFDICVTLNPIPMPLEYTYIWSPILQYNLVISLFPISDKLINLPMEKYEALLPKNNEDGVAQLRYLKYSQYRDLELVNICLPTFDITNIQVQNPLTRSCSIKLKCIQVITFEIHKVRCAKSLFS